MPHSFLLLRSNSRYFKDEAREIFINEMKLDDDTWLRAKAWALWKATYELCQLADLESSEALRQKRIIDELLNFINV